MVLTTVITLRQSPGVLGRGPHVRSRKPISTGGLYAGCQDHMAAQSAGPPGRAQLLNAPVASTPLTRVSSPGICSELALGPLALLRFSVPPVLCSLGALTSALSLQPAPLNGWEASRHSGDIQLL